jgi:hypothetical protein
MRTRAAEAVTDILLSGGRPFMENLMYPIRLDNAGDNRLRFVFDDAVVSFRLAADATFEDVALTFDELAPQHHGNPVAIDVTLGSSQGDPVLHMSC